MIHILFEAPQKWSYFIILEISRKFLPNFADSSPSVFFWNIWISQSRADWYLANKMDEELWEYSDDVIRWQLAAHCVTSSCPCAQKFWSRFSGVKTLLLIKQRQKYVLNKIFWSYLCLIRRTCRTINCRLMRSILIIIFNWNSRSKSWNHFLTSACKHRVKINKVTNTWLVTGCNSFELQFGILIQQCKKLTEVTAQNFFCESDNWSGTYLREIFRNTSSRDKIFLTVECDALKCIAIMCVLANGNFSGKCSSGGPKIENCFLARASSRQEILSILKRASHRKIWACEYTANLSVFVSFFWIFQVPQPFSKK
jgi:hypothetical protein